MESHQCSYRNMTGQKALSDESINNFGNIKSDMKKSLKCQVCGLDFAYVSLYKRHMLVHTPERRFKCNICGRKFKRSDTLKTHLNIHTGNSRIACCSKIFNSKAALRYHQKMAHSSNSTIDSDPPSPIIKNIEVSSMQEEEQVQLDSEVRELVIFGEEGISSEIDMDQMQQIKTPNHEQNSHIFSSLKLSLFK